MAITQDAQEMFAGNVAPSPGLSEPCASNKSRSFFSRFFIDPFVSTKNSPWFDASGVAVGLFVGLGVPVGTQMLVLGLSRLLFRFNAALAFACSCINNPLSVIPMYYGYYCLGSRILDKPITVNAAAFRAMLKPVTQPDYFWESFQSFVYLGRDVLMRWSVGAIVVASVVAVVGGLVCYNVQRIRCGRAKPSAAIGTVVSEVLKEAPNPQTRSSRNGARRKHTP
jgi:uncharacterized protein (DUF2062 family)